MYHANYVDYQPRHKSRVSAPALGYVVSARIQRRIRSDTVRLVFQDKGGVKKPLRGAAHAEMFAPVRRGGGVGIHAGLVDIGMLQQVQEAVDFRVILLLGLFDGALREIVPEDIFGVDAIHANAPFFVSAVLQAQSIAALRSPDIEPFRIQKMLS